MDSSIRSLFLFCLAFFALISPAFAQSDLEKYRVVYKGEKGPGVGKNIVFVATDHEYRSEESLPELAKILAKHYGFNCTVIFAGASEDLLNEGFRRMLINAAFWAMGMENKIKANNDVSLVGPYDPTTFNFEGYKANVKPGMLAGFDSLIMPGKVVQK